MGFRRSIVAVTCKYIRGTAVEIGKEILEVRETYDSCQEGAPVEIEESSVRRQRREFVCVFIFSTLLAQAEGKNQKEAETSTYLDREHTEAAPAGRAEPGHDADNQSSHNSPFALRRLVRCSIRSCLRS
jgi:DNA polymerase sigma